ncbi:hypothetical protein I601_0673 [Nocardioides dokdonensis FR1436]|uniref:Uncharacterized protein n=1 Tax=Nocardioides dokdonensis FR1436 TaxID=1300347 RepID=A0A1A9GFV4_9ACTN|nr:hypothetical protein I601_0673 [Nocardioides dokdonensis FR1436]
MHDVSDPERETEWQRRRRLAEVFGDALPETTSDERAPEEARAADTDAWLKAQVPPHHGGH